MVTISELSEPADSIAARELPQVRQLSMGHPGQAGAEQCPQDHPPLTLGQICPISGSCGQNRPKCLMEAEI